MVWVGMIIGWVLFAAVTVALCASDYCGGGGAWGLSIVIVLVCSLIAFASPETLNLVPELVKGAFSGVALYALTGWIVFLAFA